MVDIVQLSADSKVFNRPPFRSPLGACLSFRNPVAFARLYQGFFDGYFKKIGKQKEKEVYSATDMSRVFERDRKGYLDFLEAFVSLIGTDKNVTLNLIWSTLVASKLPNGVQYYGVGRSAVKPVSSNKFLDDLSQYYPYICAWKVAAIASLTKSAILLDDLQGEITEAWNELFANHIVWILPNGDLCDPTISAADLCVRYFDEKLYSIQGSLCEEDMRKICDSLKINAHIYYVGHPELGYIVPTEQRKIPHHLCYKRPMIFILKELIIPNEVEYIQKRRDILIAIERYANKLCTGYKFIDYAKDHQYLKDGDHLIYLGPHGKEQAEYLRDSLGYKINALSLDSIIRQLRELAVSEHHKT